LSARAIAQETSINKDTVKRIVVDEFGMVKVNFKWIAHGLTDDQKRELKLQGYY